MAAIRIIVIIIRAKIHSTVALDVPSGTAYVAVETNHRTSFPWLHGRMINPSTSCKKSLLFAIFLDAEKAIVVSQEHSSLMVH